uniref:RING-type domain-containing protein n=1 Tax=Trichogramma kaykai TaxID=54128 RepID=A0ABD2WAG2_9HYME
MDTQALSIYVQMVKKNVNTKPLNDSTSLVFNKTSDLPILCVKFWCQVLVVKNISYLRCVNYAHHLCHGTALIRLNNREEIFELQEHGPACLSSVDAIQISLFKDALKYAMQTEGGEPRAVYDTYALIYPRGAILYPFRRAFETMRSWRRQMFPRHPVTLDEMALQFANPENARLLQHQRGTLATRIIWDRDDCLHFAMYDRDLIVRIRADVQIIMVDFTFQLHLLRQLNAEYNDDVARDHLNAQALKLVVNQERIRINQRQAPRRQRVNVRDRVGDNPIAVDAPAVHLIDNFAAVAAPQPNNIGLVAPQPNNIGQVAPQPINIGPVPDGAEMIVNNAAAAAVPRPPEYDDPIAVDAPAVHPIDDFAAVATPQPIIIGPVAVPDGPNMVVNNAAAAAVPRPSENNAPEIAICIICCDVPKSHCFLPCGHYICCYDCSQALLLQPCPMCSSEIEQTLRIYG